MPPTILTYCKAVETAEVWSVNPSGFGGGSCAEIDIDELNEKRFLPYLSGCTWRSTSFAIIFGVNIAWWLQRGHPSFPGKWVLRLAPNAVGSTSYAWTILEEDFEMTLANTLSLEVNNEPDCNPPAEMIITPDFPP